MSLVLLRVFGGSFTYLGNPDGPHRSVDIPFVPARDTARLRQPGRTRSSYDVSQEL